MWTKVLIGFLVVLSLSACLPESKKKVSSKRTLERAREDIQGLNGQSLTADRSQSIHPAYNSKVEGISSPEKQSDW